MLAELVDDMSTQRTEPRGDLPFPGDAPYIPVALIHPNQQVRRGRSHVVLVVRLMVMFLSYDY